MNGETNCKKAQSFNTKNGGNIQETFMEDLQFIRMS